MAGILKRHVLQILPHTNQWEFKNYCFYFSPDAQCTPTVKHCITSRKIMLVTSYNPSDGTQDAIMSDDLRFKT